MASPKSSTNRRTSEMKGERLVSPSLEGTVLSALRSAQSGLFTARSASAQAPIGRGQPPGATPGLGIGFRPGDPQLARQSRQLREALENKGLVKVQTVRIRPKGEPDRRYVVEYSIDPSGEGAVLFRVRPASDQALPAETLKMLTTQQAAAVLHVSRPYVAQLVDSGAFKGVERTRSGHRRIPEVEVERVRSDMRADRRKALDDIDVVTADLRAKELEAARKDAKRRWVAKSRG